MFSVCDRICNSSQLRFPGLSLQRAGCAWRMYAPSPSCCSRVAEIYGAWDKPNSPASWPNAPRGSGAGRRQYRRMKPSALAFTFSRAKKGIPRAKLAVLITKDFCRAAPPLAAALSVATGISAATRRHPGEVCLPWCPFFVTCRSFVTKSSSTRAEVFSFDSGRLEPGVPSRRWRSRSRS